MPKIKSVISEAAQIQLATQLIYLDARLQVLESETDLSRERLLKLYKEIKLKSPPKGMLPFSTDWFLTWQPNIHSSLFVNIYKSLRVVSSKSGIELIISAYKLYLEQIKQLGLPEVLSITRAWRLIKFIDADMLTLTACVECQGQFLTDKYDLTKNYVCGLCNMPSRAGKTKHSSTDDFFLEETRSNK